VTIDVAGFWTGLTNDVMLEGDLRRFGAGANQVPGASSAAGGTQTTSPVIGTVNIYETNNPKATADKVANAVRTETLLLNGRS
jgi:anaerobic selenocysteine-containing dehydrogenase